MKNLKVFFLMAVFLFMGCGGYKKAVNKEEAKAIPYLQIEESLSNCDNDLCSKEIDGEISEEGNLINFNWLMEANVEVFFSREENLIPKLQFHLGGIEEDAVKKVTYQYIKKDNTGKLIYQGSEQELLATEGVYTIKYNVEMLAPTLANSYPEEEQNIVINIVDLNNTKYTNIIVFKVKALEIQAVKINRNTTVQENNYYTTFVPDENGVFLIDDLTITNTQERDFVLNGNIIINNKTDAIVSVKNKEQQVTNIGRPSQDFPRDIFQWFVTDETYTSYRKVIAEGEYILKILRGENLEDVSFLIDDDNSLSIHNLLIHKNEQISLLAFLRFDVDSSLLGTHGSKKFYTGLSFYNSIGSPITCNYFYIYLPYSGGLLGGAYYSSNDALISQVLSQQIYPECSELFTQTLREEYFPENTINLLGRRHVCNEQIHFNVKENGYEGDAFQNIDMVLETLSAEEGTYDEGLINNDYVYSGYIL